MVDLLDNTFSYDHDVAGRLRTFDRPGAISDTLAYDEDDRLSSHKVGNGSASAFKYTGAYLRSATLGYDARGKLVFSGSAAGPADTLTTTYSGLGHVLSGRVVSHGLAMNINSATSESTEAFVHDGFGNVVGTSRTTSYATAGHWRNHSGPSANRYEAGTGRLRATATPAGVDTLIYDVAGNLEFSTTSVAAPSSELRDRALWYDAAGRLRAVDARNVTDVTALTHDLTRVFEEYRYDALGRRVWVRARQWCVREDQDLNGYCQLSKVRRIVWDGAQELWEIQMPGEDTLHMENDTTPLVLNMFGTHYGSAQDTIDPNPFFGRVAYTHAIGVDQPVGVMRFGYGDRTDTLRVPQSHRALDPFLISPVWNERGQPGSGVFDDGGIRRCDVARCIQIFWPDMWFAYVRPVNSRSFWHGSLLEDKQDATGTNFRRNRYYDPATGRFTQEDPIGLAGGLNLYGFAGGDPVNFSDPYGLAACPPQCGSLHAGGAALGAAVGGVLGGVGGAIAGTIVLPLAGTFGGGAAGAIAGSTEGALVGLFVANVAEVAVELGLGVTRSLGDKIRRGIRVIIIVGGRILGGAMGDAPPHVPPSKTGPEVQDVRPAPKPPDDTTFHKRRGGA